VLVGTVTFKVIVVAIGHTPMLATITPAQFASQLFP
jgi:hypothetical protein